MLNSSNTFFRNKAIKEWINLPHVPLYLSDESQWIWRDQSDYANFNIWYVKFFLMLEYDPNIYIISRLRSTFAKTVSREEQTGGLRECLVTPRGECFDLQFNMGTTTCVQLCPVKLVNISDSSYRNYSDVPDSVKFLLYDCGNWLSKTIVFIELLFFADCYIHLQVILVCQ